jgi:hypothetical protein
MLIGIGVIAFITITPSLFIYSQIKPPTNTVSRVTIGNLFPFSLPKEPDLTRFNIEFINAGSVVIDRLNLQLDGELTDNIIDDHAIDDKMNGLRRRLEEDEKTGSQALDVGQQRVVTIGNVSATSDQIAQLNKGELLLYAFSVVEWGDSSLGASEYWHRELCGFFQGSMNIMHTCPKISGVPERRVRY